MVPCLDFKLVLIHETAEDVVVMSASQASLTLQTLDHCPIPDTEKMCPKQFFLSDIP